MDRLNEQATSLVLLQEDEEVWDRLNSADFLHDWQHLHLRCTWATAFQDIPFIKTWWSIYQEDYSPLLLYQSSETGGLSGLLALARNRRTGDLVVAGAEQAEYKCWLAGEEDNGRFLVLACTMLSRHFPKGSLRFNFLPAGTPLEKLTEDRTWSQRAFLHTNSRPLMDIHDLDAARKSLAKKSNKSRINRLKKQGDLRLVVLESAAALEEQLSQISDHYDLRQGGANGVMPFRNDKRKATFLASLMEGPDLFSACVLMLDDRVLAANLGIRSGDTISVGVFSFSPLYAAHSPGKLLLLFMSEQLARRGVHTLDLTPGGDWKERFANRHDEVVELSIYFDRRKALAVARRRDVEHLGRKVLAHVGLSPAMLKRSIKSCKSQIVCLRQNSGWMSGRDYRCYRLDTITALEFTNEPRFLRNNLTRLLDASAFARSNQIFLQHCLSRLEAGGQFYALKDGPSRSIFWIKQPRCQDPSLPNDHTNSQALHKAALVFRDEEIQTDDQRASMVGSLLCQIAQDRMLDGDGKETFVLVRRTDSALEEALRELGCRRHG